MAFFFLSSCHILIFGGYCVREIFVCITVLPLSSSSAFPATSLGLTLFSEIFAYVTIF